MFEIWGAKNCRTNLHKHPGPPFQIRGGPGSFSNALILALKQAAILVFSHYFLLIGQSNGKEYKYVN